MYGMRRMLRYEDVPGGTKLDRELLRRVWGYAKPYLGRLSWMLVAIVLVSLIELVPPLLYRDLFDTVLPNQDYNRLTLLGLLMLAVPLLSSVIGLGQRYLSAQIGEGVIFDLRQGMYDHLQRMGLRFFTNTKSGVIISRFEEDVVGAQNAITGTLPSLLTNGVTLLSTLAVMLAIEWRLTLMAIVAVPLFLLPARRVSRILRDIRRQAMDYNAQMSTIVGETLSISGALLSKTFGRQPEERERYRQNNENVRSTGLRRALIGRLFSMWLELAGTIGMVLIFWGGGYFVLQGTISSGSIVAFVAYIFSLYGPIASLSNLQVEFATSMVSFERVFEFLDMPIEIQDKPNAITPASVKGDIRFENVSFSYLDEKEIAKLDERGQDDNQVVVPTRSQALRDISFHIRPGQLAALVGPSGAGKTTATYLLPRLYDPNQGRILLDGNDLRDLKQEWLAHQIGVVTQESYLFHDTVRANLLYARPEATQADLETAARAANIHDMIAGLPNGYDTIVGERGYRMSGGEKQRLSIARVILKDPRILILDEATSHLDSQSEALIQAALEPLMRGRTSLVIAHRLSTILAADVILVLKDGRLVEQGTHAELLALDGLYADLYETQFRHTQTEQTPAV
ncbi:MAG: ABC transporter ATP-binding protein [Anaerolineales bacterium]|nr:ABC transporter ATP-binding protein [Anaerolineales bacterium]MCW5855504.1 ABC transporter ATP-binding protein [Anaerolineales bacterium]